MIQTSILNITLIKVHMARILMTRFFYGMQNNNTVKYAIKFVQNYQI